MYYVYILFSPLLDRFYIGETENVEQRVIWHNHHHFKKASTKITIDWQLKLQITLSNRAEARIVEQYIKSMKSSKFLKKLIEDKEFLNNFKELVKQKFKIDIC